jgi:endonuclease I
MRLIKKSMIFILLFVGSLSIGGVLGQSTTTVDVSVTSYFDGSEISNTISGANYGSSLSIQSSLSEQGGYAFAYFVVNNVVEEHLTGDNNFIVKNKMDIKAIFTPTDKHVVLFRDSNGILLDIEYVVNGATVSDSGVTLPDKPGMVISTNKWSGSLESITSNTVLTLQYDIDTSDTFTLDVVNGEGDGTYAFNEEVTVSAPETFEGKFFSHFEEDGQIISRQNSIVITVLGNRTITAVYSDDIISNAPFVSVSNDLMLRGGYSSFMGHFYVPEGFTLIEYGMISSDNPEYDLSTEGITVHQAEIINPDTTEFLMSFNQINYNYVRGYLVFKDTSDNIVEIYSDTKACGSVSVEELFYETDFEDGSKGSYAIGTVTLSGKTWTMSEALIGSLDNDQFNGTKGSRLKVGYLKTEFTVSNLSKISFYQGRYLGDDPNSFDLDISLDGATWVTIDDNVSADVFSLYEFELSDTVYSNNGLSADGAYYIRINHSSGERLNVDDIKIYAGGSNSGANPTTNTSKQTQVMTMNVSGLAETTFNVGDPFPGVCTATDMIYGSVPCSISGYNMNTAGTYDVLFSSVDYEGITHTSTVTITVSEVGSIRADLQAYLSVDYTGYYDGIEGLYGEDLMIALRAIIQEGFIAQSYGDARYALDYIDADPNNANNILLIYNRDSISNVWDGTSWNREHVWPNSRLGVPRVDNSDRSIASDYHNLRGCDSGLNSSRSNDIFTDSSDGTFYPGIDDQGDVARILFYMATMYPQLTITDEATSKDIGDDSYTAAGALMGDLDDLLAWNNIDTTDLFETTRNNRIEEYQDNRNPFIDYPYLADLIWDYETTN